MRISSTILMAFLAAATAIEMNKPLEIPVEAHIEDYEPLAARDPGTMYDKRDDQDPVCDHPSVVTSNAEVSDFHEGLHYLRKKVKVPCTAPISECVRVSCSWNAAVYLCNNSGHDISIPCLEVADYAQHIIDTCKHPGEVLKNTKVVMGHMDNTEGWSVAIGWNTC
ncbi:hypothetical protein F4780DRAFT_787719 [Xylariomycetidae sp. FL0641]|nr:hypothetical protein F4780DRAFT_787719 [Xylariomycetidae sp. FL0641]